jgi:hypothetical protein
VGPVGMRARGDGYVAQMDRELLRRVGSSLRELILPLLVFLFCLQVFEILLMPLGQ